MCETKVSATKYSPQLPPAGRHRRNIDNSIAVYNDGNATERIWCQAEAPEGTRKHYLQKVFEPESVAVVGASERELSVGERRNTLSTTESKAVLRAFRIPVSTSINSTSAADATIWHLDDGTDIVVRPIRPEDAIIEKSFVENLSVESRYFRLLSQIQEVSQQMLARFTQIDYDREMALVAVIAEGSEDARIIGVARYISHPDGQSCEFALTVADDWQKKGIGRQLMQRLMAFARDRGLEIMEGDVLAHNHKMHRLCNNLGFRKVHDPESPDVTVVRRHL